MDHLPKGLSYLEPVVESKDLIQPPYYREPARVLVVIQQVDSLRKGLSSDRRPVLDLLAVEGWRALLGILDGQVSWDMLAAYGYINECTTSLR